MTKPVSGQTTFGAQTSGTTTQLDNNFLLAYNALNDYNTYANYLVDNGAANAMSVSVPVGMTGALTDGLMLQIKVAAANTAATTLNYNGGGALSVTNLDGTALSSGQLPLSAIVQVQYRASTTSWLLQTPMSLTGATSATKVVTRQAIQTAPMDANGLSVLIPASCTSLILNTANVNANTPLVVASANGYTGSGANDTVGISSGGLTWVCTANQVNYLGVLVAANGNLTTVVVGNANGNQPVTTWGTSNTNGNGNYTFSIQNMQMLVGNGTAVAQSSVVFVGEANCNSNAVVTGTSYAVMARYDSGYTATLVGTGTSISKTHNIGIYDSSGFGTFITGYLYARCITAEAGFSVGDVIPLFVAPGAFISPPQIVTTAKTVQATSGSTAAFDLVNKSTGAAAVMTAANWAYAMRAKRAF